MKKQVLFAAMAGVLFLGCSAVAHAQSCQNQTCQAPSSTGNPNCWTCTNDGGTGYSCSLSGSCPQSCSTNSCSSGGDPCAANPVAAGCTNPCISDPNAPEGCGTEIICDGTTITSCSGSGGGGGGGTGGGGCITGGTCLIRPMNRSLLKDVAALVPRAPTSCQASALPKKLLFSL